MNSMDGHTQVGNGYTIRHALVINADSAYHFHMDNSIDEREVRAVCKRADIAENVFGE